MYEKFKKDHLVFKIIERHVFKLKDDTKEIVELNLQASKPIPKASHGTIRLIGKLK